MIIKCTNGFMWELRLQPGLKWAWWCLNGGKSWVFIPNVPRPLLLGYVSAFTCHVLSSEKKFHSKEVNKWIPVPLTSCCGWLTRISSREEGVRVTILSSSVCYSNQNIIIVVCGPMKVSGQCAWLVEMKRKTSCLFTHLIHEQHSIIVQKLKP